MKDSIKVRVRMICEKWVEVDVAIPIESLDPDADGIYSSDQIQVHAAGLAEGVIDLNYNFDSYQLDSFEILDCPKDFDYWT